MKRGNDQQRPDTGITSRVNGLAGRSTEEIIVLALCALGLIGIAPFMVARLFFGEMLIATIDGLVLIGVLVIAARVWTTRRVRPFNLILSIFYLAVMVFMVNLKGVVLLGWAYPTIMAPFFLLGTRSALGLGIIAVIGLLPAIFGELSFIDAGTAITTLALTVMFAWVFAVETTRQRTSLHEQAHSDPLTHAGNRRALEDTLRQLVNLRDRGGVMTSLILFDLDHFKQINDDYGHEIGDALLVELVEVVSERLRRTDALFRIGGEEFVALVSTGDTEGTLLVAEDLRNLIETTRFTRHGLAITISLGVAEVQPGDEPVHWLKRADDALYQAKHEGRNTVRYHEESAPEPA